MDIVSIEQCLKQLNNEVKTKIINKQNEMLGKVVSKCLEERLGDKGFRKKLLGELSSKESQYLFSCIQEYSPYLYKAKKEAEVVTMEKKLTLLFLGQKGLLYKLDQKKHHQAYVVPVEIVESYFEFTFKYEKVQLPPNPPLTTRKYLYYLMELIIFLKEHGHKKRESFQLLKTRISTNLNWDMLLRFLLDVGLVEKHHDQFRVKVKQCDRFFKQSNQEIEFALASFCLNDILENSFCSSFLIWIIYNDLGGGIELKQISHYLKKNNLDVEKSLNWVIEQLIIIEIATVTEAGVIFSANQIGEDKEQQGIEITIGQLLVPVFIRNDAIWTFRCWGTFQNWDMMIQIGFSELSFREALLEERQLENLLQFLTLYLPEQVIMDRWQQSFKQWKKKVQPIVKKQNLTLYSVTEPIFINYVEEHWHNWFEKADNGIIIENSFEQLFEELLKELKLNVMTEKIEQAIANQNFLVSIINEFPEASSVFPELEKLPKQFFTLTFYDEKTMQRIVKQAIVLELSLKIEINNNEKIKLCPLRLSVNNGCYEISGKESKKVTFTQIKKIAIVDPLE